MSFLNEYNKFMSKFYLFCRHNRCNSTCPLYDISETYKDVACKQLLFVLPDKAIAIVEGWCDKFKADYTPAKQFLFWIKRTNLEMGDNFEKPWQKFKDSENGCGLKKCSYEIPCQDCNWWTEGILHDSEFIVESRNLYEITEKGSEK